MKNMNENITSSIPEGFTCEFPEDKTIQIHHRRTGLTALKVLLGIFFGMWGTIAIALLLEGKVEKIGVPFLLIGPGMALAVKLLFFSAKEFHLNATELLVDTHLLFWKHRRIINKRSITGFIQRYNPINGFVPSWKLILNGEKKAKAEEDESADLGDGEPSAKWRTAGRAPSGERRTERQMANGPGTRTACRHINSQF